MKVENCPGARHQWGRIRRNENVQDGSMSTRSAGGRELDSRMWPLQGAGTCKLKCLLEAAVSGQASSKIALSLRS
jgi:hypothetical protein